MAMLTQLSISFYRQSCGIHMLLAIKACADRFVDKVYVVRKYLN